jgi:prevent-host-death family protein
VTLRTARKRDTTARSGTCSEASIARTVNIHEAKTHLSRLVEQAARGESFIIAKAGKPMVKVVPLDAPLGDRQRRIGFLVGQISVPDDFDRMGEREVAVLFGAATHP